MCLGRFKCLLAVLLMASGVSAQEYIDQQPVRVLGYDDHLMEPFLTRDGKTLFFNNRNEPGPQTDLHVAEALGDGSFRYLGKLEGANSDALDGVPTMDRNGAFYFVSPRSYEDTKSTIYGGRYASGRVADVRLVPGSLSRDTTFWFNMDVEVSADGSKLYATDNIQRYLVGGGVAQSNFFVAERRDDGFYRSEDSDDIFKTINTVQLEYAAAISEDELTIFFNRTDIGALRREDMRGIGIFMATRSTPDAAFDEPKRIEAITGFVEGPTISSNNCILYYHRKSGERFSLYRVTRKDCINR